MREILHNHRETTKKRFYRARFPPATLGFVSRVYGFKAGPSSLDFKILRLGLHGFRVCVSGALGSQGRDLGLRVYVLAVSDFGL